MPSNSHRTIRSLLVVTVALLVAGGTVMPVLATGSGTPTATAGDASVSVTPANGAVEVGETHTVDVALDAANGVQGYNVSVSLDNATVANVTDVALVGNPPLRDVQFAADNSSVTVEAGFLQGRTGESPLALLEVNLTGVADGATNVSVSVDKVTDADGDAYEITSVVDGSLSVTRPAPAFEITGVSAPDSVTQGETASFEATVENTGDASGETTVGLDLAGNGENSSSGTLAPGETATLALEAATGDLAVGTHTYEVTAGEDNESGTVEILDPSVTTELTLTPENATVDTGTTQNVTVVLDPASGGLQGVTLSVNLSDGSVGSIADVYLSGAPTLRSVDVSDDGASVAVEAGYTTPREAADSLALVTVAVTGQGVGATAIEVTDSELTDAEGDAYTVVGTSNATLTVESSGPVVPGGVGPARNTDDDPLLEDVNGDGTVNLFDALTYYNARSSPAITDNPAQFNFDGRGDAGTLFDAIALYNLVR